MATILDGLMHVYSLLAAMIDKKADNTAMTGASTSAAGKAGLVPAPAKGAATRYLRSDGTWQVPPDNNTVYTHPTGAGSKHIPSGGSSGQILRWSADGTAAWGADNNTVYTHPTSAGNKHIPSGGSAGKVLKWKADGEAQWADDNNTTYSSMTAATASAAGKAGLVPAPAAGKQASYLRGDGTWATPPATAHQHAVTDITTGGTLPVRVNANADAQANLANLTLRNIYIKQTAMTAGSTALQTGTICLVYE